MPMSQRGMLKVSLDGEDVTVDKGESIAVDGAEYLMTCVSMVNPYCVLFVGSIGRRFG